MLGAGFLFTFVTGPSAFAIARVDVPSLQWTSDADVQAALALPQRTNAFELDTAPIRRSLEALPGVASAAVRVALPDATLVVSIAERVPVLAWQVGATRFLADSAGVIFATIPADARAPAGVAVVDDRRVDAAAGLAIGGRLDPVDLDVATRLGSLRPADLGSTAPRLRISVTDSDGYLLSVEKGWTAVFGFYSPATRPAGMIPGQVRLLHSLLAGREATVERVILASETDGTFVPKATPRPTKR
ncbi:MAG TPA: FtsQ-type POTRA domain-containing protein [Candidatus Limnocylindrales bacterium]|nr:FtsQ-type POTRA domain-containing protein [Candidatus Limnocylindrales bacterium]